MADSSSGQYASNRPPQFAGAPVRPPPFVRPPPGATGSSPRPQQPVQVQPGSAPLARPGVSMSTPGSSGPSPGIGRPAMGVRAPIRPGIGRPSNLPIRPLQRPPSMLNQPIAPGSISSQPTRPVMASPGASGMTAAPIRPGFRPQSFVRPSTGPMSGQASIQAGGSQPSYPPVSGAPVRPIDSANMQRPGPAITPNPPAPAPTPVNPPVMGGPKTSFSGPSGSEAPAQNGMPGAPISTPLSSNPVGAVPTSSSHRSKRVYTDPYSQPTMSAQQPPVPGYGANPSPYVAQPAASGYMSQPASGGMTQPSNASGYGSAPAPNQPGYGQVPSANQVPGVQPGYGPSPAGTPTQPQSYGAGAPGMNQLTNQFSNMQMNAPRQPTLINLGQSAPQLDAFLVPSIGPNVNAQSVTQTPTANAPPSYKRCTLNAIPQTPALFNKLRLPFGLLITPYRQLLQGDEPVPVISAPQIVRCRRCRTYINPFVTFVEQGTRWKCNMCFLTNEVPSFFDWDPENRNRIDRMTRPELTHGVVEFVAPQEYMVRPPQPVVMLFLIDVSYGAVQSGLIPIAAKATMDSLDNIPNSDSRTKVGFITFDSTIHFYNLASQFSEPQMMVSGDLDEPFLPLPYDLLVSLTESRAVIESLLSKLPYMHRNNRSQNSALGKVLKFAQKMIAPIGGKIVILQHALPSVDEGLLKNREDPKLYGTPKESTLLQAAVSYYKSFAVECSPSQVSIDVFLFNPQYADVATLSGCAKFTGGSVYYYPGFQGSRQEDAIKFGTELGQLLSRPLGLEAVMRVRASKGIKMTSFHGNFFLRSSDLLSLPNVNPDHCYGIEMTVNEELLGNMACFQTALLHTSSNGERRIRVLTLAVPITNSISEVFTGIDQLGLASLLMKKGVERALSSKMEDAREALTYKLAEIIAMHKHAFAASAGGGQLLVTENLNLLPVLILGMIKNIALRSSTSIPSDLRSYFLALHYVMSPELGINNLYPRFWPLHILASDESIGSRDADGKLVFPPQMNLSSEKLDRSGLYLLENGMEIFIWIGKSVDPSILESVFGLSAAESIAPGKTRLPILDNSLNLRVNNLIAKIREDRLRMGTIYPHLYIVREDGDPNLRLWFLSQLIEDRFETLYSYPQFIAQLRDSVSTISV